MKTDCNFMEKANPIHSMASDQRFLSRKEIPIIRGAATRLSIWVKELLFKITVGSTKIAVAPVTALNGGHLTDRRRW